MQVNSKSTLPNREGFEFIAVFADGSIKEDKIFKKYGITGWPQGMHTCTHWKEMIGWRRKN